MNAHPSRSQEKDGSMFDIRFPIPQIKRLAALYIDKLRERDQKMTGQIENDVFPSYRQKRYLTKQEFLMVCAWKTPRSKPRCESNDEEYVREISALVMQRTTSERLRIEAWTLLSGVKWPTASVFLHFGFPDNYPIIDFRALWSLRAEVPAKYNFEFWEKYTQACRRIARKAGVTMRILDQALWKYSELSQGK